MNAKRPARVFRLVLFIAAGLCCAALAAVSLTAWQVDPVPELPPESYRGGLEYLPVLPPPGPKPEKGTAPVPEYELTTRPVPLEIPRPLYTESARRARIQGKVILEVMIDEKGRVINTRVLKGLPMGLDPAAVEAVRSVRFQPGTLHGKTVTTFHVMVVDFSLKR